MTKIIKIFSIDLKKVKSLVYHLVFHDAYELPLVHSPHFYTMNNHTENYLILPEMISYDESLKDLEADE